MTTPERRDPIVVVLGHIDHGKTTLLDQIRKTKVAEKEAGGITQHIGAYEAEYKGKKITFIDTPGHEAFSKMRSRGAKVADLALLVVAADDGVRPQTEEALAAIREAKLPFIVVLNKIDKDTADPDRVKKELGEREVYLEEWGGKVPVVKVSAKSGQGLEDLLEMILLVAELENLEGNFSKPALGVVIESRLDPRRGNSATLLLLEGSLKAGDFVEAGGAGLKIKILEDFAGRALKEARASSPVLVAGFDKVPPVGSTFRAFKVRQELEKALQESGSEVPPLRKAAPAEGKTLVPLVLKADTAGSLEALEHEVKSLERGWLGFNILRSEVGSVSEDDLKLASALPGALVLGLGVKIEKSAEELALRFGTMVRSFKVIYELGEFLRKELSERLPEEKEVKILGRVLVLKLFKKEGAKQIVGGRVSAGNILAGRKARLLRRGFPLTEGRVLELQQGRLKVKEVEAGKEAGILFAGEVEISPGDELEVFEEVFTKKTIS